MPCKNRMALLPAALALLVTAVAAPAGGARDQQPVLGLAVQPGGLLMQDVKLGETYDLQQVAGITLAIFNQDGQAHAYLLSTHRPSQSGGSKPPPGYTDLPDPSWFWFERTEVTVPAQSSSQVRMYLRIPDDQQYANQRWSVTAGVTGKPRPDESIALAVYPRYEIETVALGRPELQHKPDGEFGLVPSTVVLEGMHPGDWRESEFYICNSDRRGRRYRFRVVSQDEAEGKLHITKSPAFSWMPDPGWMRTREARVFVRHNVAMPVRFRVKLPRSVVLPDGGWESILLVTRDDGLTRFLRVRVPSPPTPGQEGAN